MKPDTSKTALIPPERIENAILLLRGHKVMFDSDLAALCEVETRQLDRAVKRNIDRFPAGFSFQRHSLHPHADVRWFIAQFGKPIPIVAFKLSAISSQRSALSKMC